MVGERGLKLSGGEKQRVAIARAFLRWAKCHPVEECCILRTTSASDAATLLGPEQQCFLLRKVVPGVSQHCMPRIATA